MPHNPFLVGCPDCGVRPGVRCRIGNRGRIPNEDGNAVHAARIDSARLRLAVHGTCNLCGRLMLQMTDPDETRHAQADEAGLIPPCPPYPDHSADYVPSGAEQFVRNDVQPAPPEDQPNPPPPEELPLPPGLGRPGHSDPMQNPPGSAVQ